MKMFDFSTEKTGEGVWKIRLPDGSFHRNNLEFGGGHYKYDTQAEADEEIFRLKKIVKDQQIKPYK